MKRATAAIMILFVLFSAFAACGNGAEKTGKIASSGRDDFIIGAVGTLTGDSAAYGVSLKNGLLMAVEEINAKKEDVSFTLLFEDDHGDSPTAMKAYDRLKDGGAQMIVGPADGGFAGQLAQATNADRLFHFIPGAADKSVLSSDSGRLDNVFTLFYPTNEEGAESARYVFENELADKVAVIYQSGDPGSVSEYNSFIREAPQLGIEVVSINTCDPADEEGIDIALGDARESGAELLFLPVGQETAAIVLRRAAQLGYFPNVFVTSMTESSFSDGDIDASYAEKIVKLSPFDPDAQDEKTVGFVNAYKKRFGETPDSVAAGGYDAAYALFEAIKRSGMTCDAPADQLCDKLIEVFTVSDFYFDGLIGENVSWSSDGMSNAKAKASTITASADRG